MSQENLKYSLKKNLGKNHFFGGHNIQKQIEPSDEHIVFYLCNHFLILIIHTT